MHRVFSYHLLPPLIFTPTPFTFTPNPIHQKVPEQVVTEINLLAQLHNRVHAQFLLVTQTTS